MAVARRPPNHNIPEVVYANRRPDGFVLLQRSALAQRMNAARAEGQRLAALSRRERGRHHT